MNNAGLDQIDERHYPYSYELGGSTKDFPAFVFFKPETQDQYKEGYNMGCVYYSVSMHDNLINKRDGIEIRTKGAELCEVSTTWSKTLGDYIINGPKLLKELGHIKGYFNVNTLQDLLYTTAQFPVSTGSNKINWKLTRTGDYIAHKGNGTGHAFTIYGRNNTDEYVEVESIRVPPRCFIIGDSSFGFNGGYFYIKIDEAFDLLYNTKVVFTNNTEVIDNYKRKMIKGLKLHRAKLAFLLGMWNGERPNDFITREENAATAFSSATKNITAEDIAKAEAELKRLT